MTSSHEQSNALCIAVFNFDAFEKDKIKTIDYAYYFHSDFISSTKVKMKFDFNIRDIIAFSISPSYFLNDKIGETQQFLIVSCYNNGLLFFKAVNLIEHKIKKFHNTVCNFDEFENPFNLFYQNYKTCCVSPYYKSDQQDENKIVKPIPLISMYFYLSFIYDIKNIGKIYIEEGFNLNDKSKVSFFSSSSSPPVVYEFMIDEYLNINTKKIYDIKNIDAQYQRFIGQDKICVNEKYIAFLLYDYKSLKQVIRIFYRDETNFGIGHADITLREFNVDVSTIKFLEYSNSNAIYVRNAENWRIYKVNDIEFVLDAQTYDSTIFPYLFNTYEIIITCYQTSIYSEDVLKVQLHFNITFTDPTDMNLYFIRQTKDQVMLHSYGDENFNVRLDDFYMGPNKIFGFELVSSSPFGPNITLPKIFNAYEKKITAFQLDLKHPCSKALVLRKTNNIAPYSYLSLHCILENYIEHYIYDNEGRNVIKQNRKEYLNSNFIDYFITKDATKYFGNKELLVILSKEKSNQIYEYVIHIFDIEKENIFWMAKFYFNKDSSKLREHKPIIPLPYTRWVILVGESQKELYFVPNDPEKLIYTLYSEKKIMFAFPTISDQLYVSHYNDNKVSIYKVYKYEEESGESTISIEFIRHQVFNRTYVWFDIDIYGLALVFTNLNTIYIYQIKTLFDMKIVRIINFFKFRTTYEFCTNKDKNDIVYYRKDSYLFIVMSNMSDPAQRSLFIFDLSVVSHNSLKSIIELDKTHFSQQVYLKINADEYFSVIYVYLHNEKNYFRLIQFEPENSLRKRIKAGLPLFLPYEFSNFLTIPEGNVTIKVFPLDTGGDSLIFNTTFNLTFVSKNDGLLIESRRSNNSLSLANNEGAFNISLLDYFDGFNQYYTFNEECICEDDFIKWQYKLQHVDSYIIDLVTSNNQISCAIIYQVYYLLLFYERNHLMQLYTIHNEIKKIGDYDYYDIFHNCEITYIYLLKFSREYNLLVVQCINATEYIDAVYSLRFYILEIDDDYSIRAHNITSVSMNRRAKDVKIVDSSLSKDDLYVIVLTNEGIKNDSIIYLVSMNCTLENKSKDIAQPYRHHLHGRGFDLKCELTGYDIYNGVKLNFDQFIVNSFMFLHNEPLFVVSVDNYGIMIIDIVSNMVVDRICFNSLIPELPNTFSIVKLLPIENNGIRIQLHDRSGFSLFWRGIAKIGDQEHVFIDLTVQDFQVTVNDGIRTSIIDSSGTGYTRVVYNNIKSNYLNDAFIRIYFHKYHKMSKMYSEIDIGTVSSCVFISQKFSLNRIVLVCGSKIYLVHITVYPSVVVDIKPFNKEYTCSISANNGFSYQIINIYIKNLNGTSFRLRWLVAFLFVLLILTLVCCVECISNKIFTNKNKEKENKCFYSLSSISSNNELIKYENKEDSIRSTPKFEDPDDQYNKITERLLLKHEESSSTENLRNSLKTDILSSKIRHQNKLNFINGNKNSGSGVLSSSINKAIQNQSLISSNSK